VQVIKELIRLHNGSDVGKIAEEKDRLKEEGKRYKFKYGRIFSTI
jgi:hypothetical protein